MAGALATSMVLNVVLVCLAGAWLARRRRRHTMRDPSAHQMFAPVVDGQLVFAGDSHVRNAPLGELLAGVSQRGINGERILDVAEWVGTLRGARRVVLMVGTNDWAYDLATVDQLVERWRVLLDRVPVGAEPVMLGLPPVAARDVTPANEALVALTAERGVRAEMLPDLTGCSLDGVHLTHEGYVRLGSLFREVFEVGGPRAGHEQRS